MEERVDTNYDIISRLIKHCHQDKEMAERLYQEIIVQKKRNIQLPDGQVLLTDRQVEEFVEHFSSEVGPEIWTSKRLKY